MSRPQLRVPPTSDRVLLNGRTMHIFTNAFVGQCNQCSTSKLPKQRLSVAGKLLFTTTTKNGSSPPRVSVYSAVLAEAKPDEVGVPSTALLHTFTLAEQDRILMVAPVQPNPVQQPQEQPEPKPETAKKPFKLLVIIDKALSTFLYICSQVCVTTDENGVETKTNLVKPSPSSSSTSSQTSSHFETRAKVKRPESDRSCLCGNILTFLPLGSFGDNTVKVLRPLLRLCYSHYKVSFLCYSH